MSTRAGKHAGPQAPLAETYGLDAYRVDAYVPERLVEELHDGRTLGRLLARKLVRKLSGGRIAARSEDEGIAAFYAGIAVFDQPRQHRGGMAFGRDFPRVLNELGVGRCNRLFEFGAGPGYIGYSCSRPAGARPSRCPTSTRSRLQPRAIRRRSTAWTDS